MTYNRNIIPNVENLPISRLASIFNNTTNSYKYLFFIALLNLMENSQFSRSVFPVNNIYTEMLTIAWYPHTYFRLNFGSQDKIGVLLDRIGDSFTTPAVLTKKSRESLTLSLRKYIKEISNTLDRYVKFRLLRPFFYDEVKNLEDTLLHNKIKMLAYNRTEEFLPLYYISENESEIIIPPPWINYIYTNIKILRNFAAWEWLLYMQKRNLTIPNMHLKLFPPQKREALAAQTGIWKTLIFEKDFHCIYSGVKITTNNLSLDHFLPWTYFAHDELYNLTPTTRNINSAKSNSLPSQKRYLEPFIEQQLKFIETVYSALPGKYWKIIKDSYMNSFGLSERDLINRKDKLSKTLEDHFKANWQIAENQGFSPNWVYTPHQC